MSFFKSLFNAVASSVQAVVGVARVAAETVYDFTSRVASTVQIKYKEWEEWLIENRLELKDFKNDRFSKLKDINDEILEYQRKEQIDGCLSAGDVDLLEQLYTQKGRMIDKIHFIKDFEAAKDIVDNTDQYSHKEVDIVDPQELSRLKGQVMMGKKCPSCGLPQVIRFRSTITNPTFRDLFWGCAGYFVYENGRRKCTKTVPFSPNDRTIFANIHRPGMELSTARQNDLILHPAHSQIIQAKLKDAQAEETDDFLCPIHQEKMVLLTNKNAENLLDLYHLQCSRIDCLQKIKVNSAGQLDAVMQSYGKGGLFQ